MTQREHSSSSPTQAGDGLMTSDAMRAMTDHIVTQSEALIKAGRQSIAQSAALASALNPEMRALHDLDHSKTSDAFQSHVVNVLAILERAPSFSVPDADEVAAQAVSGRARRARRSTPDSFV